jgi:hypothetical protein
LFVCVCACLCMRVLCCDLGLFWHWRDAAVSFIVCRMGFGMWLAYSATVNITPFVAHAQLEGKSFEAVLGQAQYWLMIVSRCAQHYQMMFFCRQTCCSVYLRMCIAHPQVRMCESPQDSRLPR